MAAAVPLSTFLDDGFIPQLAAYIEHASIEPATEFTAKAFKADTKLFECRDSSSPDIITSLLMAFLEAHGRRIAPVRLRKMTRDDICWRDAERPWRRLPYWLVLRVCLQLHLSRCHGGEIGRFEYKYLLAHLLSSFMNEMSGATSVERLSYLKTKVCRRMAKIELDMATVEDPASAVRAKELTTRLGRRINSHVSSVTSYIDSLWSKQKDAMRTAVPLLPQYASDKDMTLDLPVSGDYLAKVMSGYIRPQPRSATEATASLKATLKKHFTDATNSHSHILSIEQECLRVCADAASEDAKTTCYEAAEMIKSYLALAMPLYHGNAELQSYMLLIVIELWVAMDRAAVSMYPLLMDYQPVFHPEMLDLLLLPSYGQMVRLRNVQTYLLSRWESAGDSKTTIFNDPVPGCFSQRYYDESPDTAKLQDLHGFIESAASVERLEKHREWKSKTQQYDDLTRRIDQSTCIYMIDENSLTGERFHDPHHCPRCRLIGEQGRMRIQIYEHPLPANEISAKVVIFELVCPKAFGVYRQTTWSMYSSLALPQSEGSIHPICVLRDYKQLAPYFKAKDAQLSLASTTKSFLSTHYCTMRFPVQWEGALDTHSVCRPNGLKLGYFDMPSGHWPGRYRPRASFLNRLKLVLPKSCLFQKQLEAAAFSDAVYGQPSYEVMASATSCPAGVNVHEFLAFQGVASGVTRRWLAILAEFGSPTLNFSSETTLALLKHLSFQCGPPDPVGSSLRQAHKIFKDEDFCNKLLRLLGDRLETTEANWRESHLMDLIITLATRLADLAAAARLPIVSGKALTLLTKAREICLKWIGLLNAETNMTSDPAATRRAQRYALWAALLCKKTYLINLYRRTEICDASLESFISSSLTVAENLLLSADSLPADLRDAVTLDLRMSLRMRDTVFNYIVAHPEVFASALSTTWPQAEGESREMSEFKKTNHFWVVAIARTVGGDTEQEVMYNFVEGVLLVNRCRQGKLSDDVVKKVSLDRLFPNQALQTWDSDRNGMRYLLRVHADNFQVHVGWDYNNNYVVRAFRGKYSLQLVPKEYFANSATKSFDLPGPLLENSFHWLNLRTGEVLITTEKQPWPLPTHKGWTIDLKKRVCSRDRFVQGRHVPDTIVNIHSPLAENITRMLERIEDPRRMLIFQPAGLRRVQVELSRQQLNFFVNENGLLRSTQLQSDVDPDQDIGTWYGLCSKLVCRNFTNPGERTVLVPVGRLRAVRMNYHVRIDIEPSNGYAWFKVNAVLGRLDCAAEPPLIYMKALLHAYTSFVVPDRLTGRTGTEEAIQWLQSAICQPWQPLSYMSLEKLHQLAALTPSRAYYPADMRTMKMDYWDEGLPEGLQNALLRPLVDRIMKTSDTLSIFAPYPFEKPTIPSSGAPDLQRRAVIRQQIACKDIENHELSPRPSPFIYRARDRVAKIDMRYSGACEIVTVLRLRPKDLATTPDLCSQLAGSACIAGFFGDMESLSVNDKLTLNVMRSWGQLVRFVSRSPDTYALMLLLSTLAFHADANRVLIKVLAAFHLFDDLRRLQLPVADEFEHFQPNERPTSDLLARLLKPFQEPPPSDQNAELAAFLSAKDKKKMRLRIEAHEKTVASDTEYFSKFLLSQWPCLEPDTEGLGQALLLDVEGALEAIRPEWRRMFRNLELQKHLNEVQVILDRLSTDAEMPRIEFTDSKAILPTRSGLAVTPNLSNLLCSFVLSTESKPGYAPTRLKGFSPSGNGSVRSQAHTDIGSPPKQPPKLTFPLMPKRPARQASGQLASSAVTELQSMILRLKQSNSLVQNRYAQGLEDSLVAFRELPPLPPVPDQDHGRHSQQLSAIQTQVEQLHKQLTEALNAPVAQRSAKCIRWLRHGGLWPALTTSALLSRLSTTSPSASVSPDARRLITLMGKSITELQRQMRLQVHHLRRDVNRLIEELRNEGHGNWDPTEHPDWLLLEIESDIMIRDVQVDVAKATVSPESGLNSLLQMNMGQGKTSCIIPMAAAALADGKSLVRVLVPKALLQQTAQMLQSRLGVLLNRPLRHVPFTRKTSTAEETVRTFAMMHKDTQKAHGIMLCEPGHILSFMLSGQQRLLDNELPQATLMTKVQDWLRRVSRDILDESDHTLAVKTQLIYPSGSQMSVDGHPHRWEVVEAILRLVDAHLHTLSQIYPFSIEVVRRPGGGFPLVFFLRSDVEDELVRRLTVDVSQGFGGIIPVGGNQLSKADRFAVKDFISSPRPRPQSIHRISKICPDQPFVRQTVYLLRGLLVNRILMMALKKRWNVQYGLHPMRDPIAVPFHAKGVPSEQSEWGHPDVAILFTCLAFYYDGINLAQLRQCLEHILKSDDPSTEYNRWTQTSVNFPQSLKAWNSINTDDDPQLEEIWKAVRYNSTAVDYFLNNFVFPRHAKQFKVKLQSNGWDIPLSRPGEEMTAVAGLAIKPLTTGFSGTNDNRTMLPLNIEQADLRGLAHTSAEVLLYLLQPRNRKCLLPADFRSGRSRATETDLLRALKSQKIRILIDAGAQILEMDNFTLAKEWLRIDESAGGALFFDSSNKPMVLLQSGNWIPLIASPFAEDLSQCLVYLDDAHTRGTDLKLPPDAKGALTLGLDQTKDHTVQAAMRLRQLGTTQSISFVVPPEVHQSIIDLKGTTIHHRMESGDVVRWLLNNTCDSIEQLQPLYYSQGLDFCRRTQAALTNAGFLKDDYDRKHYVKEIKHVEQQTLQQLYEPQLKSKAKSRAMASFSNKAIQGFVEELNTRRKAFQDTGKAVHSSALQEVEQEREVAVEVELVRQVKKGYRHAAHKFPGLHHDLESFVRTGRFPVDASCFRQALEFVSNTGTGFKHSISRKAMTSRLYVTNEFARVVTQVGDSAGDNFLRPVSWVLWSTIADTAVVIIPEEAEIILHMLHTGGTTEGIHLLTYAAPTTRKMLAFYSLDYHNTPPLPAGTTLPAWLRVQIFLLAGGLYFEWADYEVLRSFLGIHAAGTDTMEDWVEVENINDDDEAHEDGDKADDTTEGKPKVSPPFTARPLTFLQEWLSIRRRGQDFAHSPMGFIAQGKPLQENHPFFSESAVEGKPATQANDRDEALQRKKHLGSEQLSTLSSSPSDVDGTEGGSTSSWADNVRDGSFASD